MKRWLVPLAVLMLGLAAIGFLVAAAGIAPIRASAGHWAITERVLQFAKRRSIATQSLGVTPPEEFAAWQVMKGAGHYETGCRPCHGGPEVRTPGVAAAMLPVPPWLPRLVEHRDAGELFFVVRHGLKFTGMPAWPSSVRDDEVWAMVAFLQELPTLDTASYRRLVHGDMPDRNQVPPLEDLNVPGDVPDVVTASCARCHGTDGEGRGNAAYPRLAGQKSAYLLESLRAYATQGRHSGIMEPIAKGLSDDDRAALARYYSQRARDVAAWPSDDTPMRGDIRLGEAIAREGVAARGIPACVECHGPGSQPRNPVYPELAGQYAGYLELQLDLFRRKTRGGTPYAHLMHYVAERLTPAEIRGVAAWYASQTPAPER